MTHSNSTNAHYDGFNRSIAFNLSELRNTSNNTCTSLILDSQTIGIGVCLSVFILFAIVGNVLVILSVLCNRHLQTVTNFFITNLAIADLLLSIIVLPFSACFEILKCWVFGRFFCNIWAAVDVMCCTASILSLCVISIDRYIGVKYSLKYPTIMTEKKAGVILVVVWMSATVISIGPLLGWKEPPPMDESICSITEEPGYAIFSSLFSFYLPLMVILVMYFRIYIVAKRTTRNLEAGVKKDRNKSREVVLRIHCRSVLEDAAANAKSKAHPFRSSLSIRLMKFSREKRAAKTLGIVVGAFILCWLPFFLVLPIGSFFPTLKPSDIVCKVVFWLGYFNSCLNPIIYACNSKEFKRAFTRLLKCQCRRSRNTHWRFYKQRLRTSLSGSGEESFGSRKPQCSFHESLSFTDSLLCKEKTRAFQGWSFFSPLQTPSSQLKKKMNSLSNKIKRGPSRRSGPTLGKAEVISVSMGICAHHCSYEQYNIADYDGLKETDI
ncbi:alpha-1A adrenergic receptor-like [Conger conger]|uniref:alpha-1A adrenergic receptor-like n=1 Tax=Conger conger TaxID=82655 RepID=UPI002A5A8332|nr:alpha-1A adrenergic receptor-like [Conger conger]XP_061107435.1 alpha-1A adrenergic receptor-like [Conger conger]